MSSIYRLRPSDEFLLEEIEKPYLWFSKPIGYKDTKDANITSFVVENSSIEESFNRIYNDSNDLLKKSKHIGICCFTENIPPFSKWRKFPKGRDGVFIEFDRECLENHFLNHYGLANCFKKVEYLLEPKSFDFFNKEYDILWDTLSNGDKIYKTLRLIENDEKLRDELFLKMFTRINKYFEFQNETRIILGGHNIKEYNDDILGYKIDIPAEAILKIHVHPKTPDDIKAKLVEKFGPKIEIVDTTVKPS